MRVRIDHQTDERRFQLSTGPTGRSEESGGSVLMDIARTTAAATCVTRRHINHTRRPSVRLITKSARCAHSASFGQHRYLLDIIYKPIYVHMRIHMHTHL